MSILCSWFAKAKYNSQINDYTKKLWRILAKIKSKYTPENAVFTVLNVH